MNNLLSSSHLSPPISSEITINGTHASDSYHNPQFFFTLTSASVIQITCRRLDNYFELGHYFYLLSRSDTIPSRSWFKKGDIIRESEIVDTTLDIVMRIHLECGNYVIMPTVYDYEKRIGFKGVTFQVELRSEVWGAIVRLLKLPPCMKREIKSSWSKSHSKSEFKAELQKLKPTFFVDKKSDQAQIEDHKSNNENNENIIKKEQEKQTTDQSQDATLNTDGTSSKITIPPLNNPTNKLDNDSLKRNHVINFQNPQFILRIKQTMEVCVKLTCSGKDATDVMTLAIVKGLNENKKRYQLGDETNVIYSSPEKVSLEIYVKVKLEASKDYPFLIIVGCSNNGDLPFKITLEYSESYDEQIELFEELPLPITDGRKDDPAEDIINKFHPFGKRWTEVNCVDEIMEYCDQNNYYFIDNLFPPDQKSINKFYWPSTNSKNDSSQVEWKRPSSFLDSPELIIDGVDVQDLVQGEDLNDAWLLQALSAVAINPNRIHEIFYPTCYSPRGVYSIKLFVEEKWQYVIIDDFLPVKEGRVAFARSKDPNELWSCLLEKAFAKVFGSYGRLEQIRKMHLGFVLLTGGYTRTISLGKTPEDQIWSTFKSYTENKWLIGALTRKNRAKFTGLVSDHFYCVLDAKEIENEKLLYLYNVWGNTEWTGEFSDHSQSWSDQQKKELSVEEKEDGLFWMRLEDFIIHFSKATLCKVGSGQLRYAYKEFGNWNEWGGETEPNKNSKILVRVFKPSKLIITLSREGKDASDEACMKFYVCRGKVTTDHIPSKHIVSMTSFRATRRLLLEVEIPPGIYFLIPVISERNQDSWIFKIRSEYELAVQKHTSSAWPNKYVLDGPWTYSGGLYSIENPCFTFEVAQHTEIIVRARRLEKKRKQPVGFIIFTGKNVVVDRRLDRSRIIFEGQNTSSKKESSELISLEPSSYPYYIMIHTSKRITNTTFQVTILSENPLAIQTKQTLTEK